MSLPEHDMRLREAALVLHGLHWRDRIWLLRRLLPAWRRSLRQLLRELRRLGIEPSFGACQEFPEVSAIPGLDAACLAIVGQAAPARVRLLLAGEPSQVQAMVLSLAAWPWRDALWNGMSALQRRRVLAAAPANSGMRPGVAQAILAGLASALREDALQEDERRSMAQAELAA